MLRVKRQPWLRRDVDVADKRSFFENAALLVAQDLSDATEFINETCDFGIGSTHHRAPIFYASKNGISQMWTRTGLAQKQAVDSDVSHNVCPEQNHCPGQFTGRLRVPNQR